MNDLSDLVLTQIFSFFKDQDALQARLVSRRWNTLLNQFDHPVY